MRPAAPSPIPRAPTTPCTGPAAGWVCGDSHVIGGTLPIVGENLVEFADLQPGERVLEVGAGSACALAAARRYAIVTATDPVPASFDPVRAQARNETLPVSFQVGDAQALPFADAGFDVVVSVFGAMYAPDPAAAAGEMRRVLRPGGRIALAGWTAQGFVGRLLALIAQHAPSPAALPSLLGWGSRAQLARWFAVSPAQVRCRRRHFNFRYRSAAHWVQVFRDFHGPTHHAFASLDLHGQQALERQITQLLEAANAAGPEALVVPGAYLETLIVPTAAVPALPASPR